jgi:cyanophycinase
LALVGANPAQLGVGIDEDTAAIVRAEGTLEVVGRGVVTVLRPESRAEAADELLAKELADSDAAFMTGGNQMKLAEICVGTAFGDAIRQLYADGGVVGGTSAGASIMSEHMVAFGGGGSTPRNRMSQLARGLGLLPDVIIDQHFRERDRTGRLMALVAQSPSLLGVGIDEDTAAIITGSVMEVAGRGAVTVIDERRAATNAATAKASRPLLVSGAVIHTLPSGSRFDLEERALLDYDVPVPAAERADLELAEVSTRRLAARIAREGASSPMRQRRRTRQSTAGDSE